MATTVFRTQDSPHYYPGLVSTYDILDSWLNHSFIGLGATIGSQVLLLALLAATTLRFMSLNKSMREGKRKEPLEGQPGFYYTL